MLINGMLNLWPAGNFGTDKPGQRRSRALTWVRAHPGDNGYAHPVEGVVTLIDLNAMAVVAVEDHRFVSVPAESGNYTFDAVGLLRADVVPLEIHQPSGPGFRVKGHEVRWQKWRFRIGFSYREGLILHVISYLDGGRERPVLHRAAVGHGRAVWRPVLGLFHRNAKEGSPWGLGRGGADLRSIGGLLLCTRVLSPASAPLPKTDRISRAAEYGMIILRSVRFDWEELMDVEAVTSKLIEAHAEIQDDIGKRPATPITATTCPLKHLNGFDSILVPVVVRMVAKKLGVPIPKDSRIENFYVTSDGRKKLRIDEISTKVATFLSSLEVTRA